MRKCITISYAVGFVACIVGLLVSFKGAEIQHSFGGLRGYLVMAHGACSIGKYECNSPEKQRSLVGRTASWGDFEQGWRWLPGIRLFQNQGVTLHDVVVPLYLPMVLFALLFGRSLNKQLRISTFDQMPDPLA